MWHAMFAEQIPLAEMILRTVLVCALIALLLRVAVNAVVARVVASNTARLSRIGKLPGAAT
jgi:hypothetical protein